ncbi:MAG: hypothetical protein FWH02_09050 [Oscillospiraceae bacterium]|nr:hypothetical protein [Oscillospiraceae bacterium]
MKIKHFLKQMGKNIIPIIITVVTLISVVIGKFFDKMDSTNAIIILLVLITVDLVCIIIGYLEKSLQLSEHNKKMLKYAIAQSTSGVSYSSDDCNYIDIVKSATKCIFYSGIAMGRFSDYNMENAFAEVSTEITITFVCANLENDDVLKSANGFFGRNKIEPLNSFHVYQKAIERMKKKRNIVDKYIDIFVPISYFAIDYKEITEFSFIQAKHYLLDENRGEIKALYCTVRPGSVLYNYYQEQILFPSGLIPRRLRRERKSCKIDTSK